MDELHIGPVIGGLTHNRVHLWGRATSPGVLHAWLGRKPDLSDARLAGTSFPLSPEAGYAGVAVAGELTPNTHYHYALTLSDSHPRPTQEDYPSFTTFPLPGMRVPFSFVFGSCFLPENQNGGKIFDAIEELRREEELSGERGRALRFCLMIGDQIYADAYGHNGIDKIACTLDEYRRVYAYTWNRPALRRLLARLPAYMTLDDHEVDDDWRWLDSQRRWATIPWWDMLIRWWRGRPPQERHLPLKRVQDALQAYWEHQGMHASGYIHPPQVDSAGQYELHGNDPGSLAYTFKYGGAAFFVLDTRSMRVRNRHERSMLGAGQWQALEKWLLEVKDTYPVKFLVTSCALLYRMWIDFPQDRWAGYQGERDRLLNFLASNGIENVYLLAGDLHQAHAIRAELDGPDHRPLPLWEFCSTPFEQDSSLVTRLSYISSPFDPVKKMERSFIFDQHNFGVVRVEFDQAGAPQVRFELRDTNGEIVAEAGEGI